jgi:hypothetical protein
MREAAEDEPWTHATGVINWGDLFWSCRDPVTDAASHACMPLTAQFLIGLSCVVKISWHAGTSHPPAILHLYQYSSTTLRVRTLLCASTCTKTQELTTIAI